MARRSGTLVALTALGAAVAATGPGMGTASTAVFASSSTSTAAIRAAADWTPPTVAMQPPAAVVAGVVTLGADASDGETALASVTLETRPPGGSWRVVCTDTTAPWSCAWDTTSLPDGERQVRATAQDGSGLVTTSAVLDGILIDNGAGDRQP